MVSLPLLKETAENRGFKNRLKPQLILGHRIPQDDPVNPPPPPEHFRELDCLSRGFAGTCESHIRRLNHFLVTVTQENLCNELL